MQAEEILSRIRDIVAATHPGVTPSEIRSDATFATLGLDSVKLIELGVRVEQVFGEDVVLDDWVDEQNARGADALTVGSLVSFIAHSLTSSADPT